jgi:Dolichyl-phosphate-mannose-protein mannosyltransferase
MGRDDAPRGPDHAWTRGETIALAIMASLSLGIHLAVNALARYGYFRDELYYIACSKRLAAGYVDQPPLSIDLLAAATALVGHSVFAIRLVPALVSALSVIVLGLLVRRMDGRGTAMVVAAICFMASPLLLAEHTYYSMNCFDILFGLVVAYGLLRVSERPTLGAWLGLGVVLGLGLLNKTSVLWMGAGVAAAVLLTGLRRELGRPGPYLAAALAFVLFSPFVVWNLRHGMPHLEFLHNATSQKYASLTRVRFLTDQLVAMNPVVLLVSLAGLAWVLFGREGSRYRVLGISFVTVLLVLLANPHTKAEYVGSSYPPLFACGGVAITRLPGRWRRIVVPALAVLLVASGVALAPLAMPILTTPDYVRYTRALGIAPSTAENKKLSDLPQFFADMNGWEELARDVSAAYRTIPETERATTVALVGNYGEAGALELYADRYPLPRVLCTHNSYWFWGPGATPITTFIRLGGKRDDYLERYGDVTAAGFHVATDAIPYEDSLGIFIARQRHTPIQDDWAKAKHFE